MKILMVLTSHDELGSTGKIAGFWLEELQPRTMYFKDAGVDITLESPKGGQPPLDPKSDEPDSQTVATARFKADFIEVETWRAKEEPMSVDKNSDTLRVEPMHERVELK